MTGRYIRANVYMTERYMREKKKHRGKDTTYKETSPAKVHEEYMMGNKRKKYMMGRLENIIPFVASPLAVLAPKRH